MNNQRLKEISLALCLNHIDKTEDKITYSNLIKTLSAVIAAIGREEYDIFISIFQKSIGDGILGATRKELVAVSKLIYSPQTISKKFNKNKNWFYYKHQDLYNRDFINEDFLNSLTPQFNTEKEKFVVDFMLNFIKNIQFELGEDSLEMYDKERTLELEFYLIYNRLLNTFHNVPMVDKIIFNICTAFNIDYASVSQLKNNMHLIDRTYPNFKYNTRYLMQEICTLYTKKGLNKGAIGSKVLFKGSNFFYNNTNKEYGKIIDDADLSWQYVPTIEWSNLEKGAVLRFIDIFHTFIRYDA